MFLPPIKSVNSNQLLDASRTSRMLEEKMEVWGLFGVNEPNSSQILRTLVKVQCEIVVSDQPRKTIEKEGSVIVQDELRDGAQHHHPHRTISGSFESLDCRIDGSKGAIRTAPSPTEEIRCIKTIDIHGNKNHPVGEKRKPLCRWLLPSYATSQDKFLRTQIKRPNPAQ